MSGIATATRAMVDACAGSNASILETRKTVPGLRVLDKWAVLIGGGSNHRMGLYDMIMIKDNHIAAAGGLGPAVEQACRFVRSREQRIEIEVETRTLEEVREVLQCIDADEEGLVSRVMLDNMASRESASDGAHPDGLAPCDRSCISLTGQFAQLCSVCADGCLLVAGDHVLLKQ